MAFDALTLSAVRDELDPLLVGARVQKLVFADELSVAIEAFAPRLGRTNVLLSGQLEQARIQRIPHLPSRGLERDTPFSLVLRKYLRDCHINSTHQPRLERVFELVCQQQDATGQHHTVMLIVEAMGRRSNLVLVGEDGLILDAARRSPPSRNPRRPVLPHLPYQPPPPQDRLFPEDLSVDGLASGADGQTVPLARYLAERIAGLSPLAGRELAFRATGHTDATLVSVDWHQVVDAAHAFLGMAESHAWQPSVAFVEDRALEYAPYALSHLQASGARVESFGSISEAMTAHHNSLAEAEPAVRGDSLRAERRGLLVPLQRMAASTQRRIAALEHQLTSGHEQRDPLRRAGEAILAHQAELPRGATSLSVGDEQVALDPLLTAVENAQAYFLKYRKAREAEARVPGLLEQARNTASHLADLHTMVEVADHMDAVRALRREVGAATGGAPEKQSTKRGKPSQPTRSAPYRRVSIGAAAGAAGAAGGVDGGSGHDGGNAWEALVGSSAAGNAAVTFDLAESDDLWFHARGIPGAHVILRTHGATPPDAVVERAAQLAAWNSAARASGAVEVDVAPRRHVRKIPNAPPGLVRYSNERTVRVTPRG